MKKVALFLAMFILCSAILCPITAYARSYSVGETDMNIEIDDTAWYVFTRNNLMDNPELDDLGVSYDYMYDLMYDNGIYLDAVILYSDSDEYLELFLRKTEMDDVTNLSEYSDTEVEELAEALAEKYNTSYYWLYKTQYKYLKVEYVQSGYHVMEYITVFDNEGYTLTFQTETPFSEWEYEEMDSIIDSISFGKSISKPAVKKPTTEPTVVEEVEEAEENPYLDKFIEGTVIALIFVGTPLLYKLGKKKKLEAIQKGKVYYGLLGCRVLWLFVLGLVCAEMLLMLILGDSIEGTKALLLVFLVATLVTIPLVFLYKKSFEERHLKSAPQQTRYRPTQNNCASSDMTLQKSTPVQESNTSSSGNGRESSSYESLTILEKALAIENTLWDIEDTRQVVDSLKGMVHKLITQEGIKRKTELLEVGLYFCQELADSRRKPDTNMGSHSITALIWYKKLFECILSLDIGLRDIHLFYITFQMTRKIDTQLHPYIQTMLKVYDTIDSGIVYLYENMDDISVDYFAITARKIKALLQNYTDDNTAWNEVNEHFWEELKEQRNTEKNNGAT